MFSVGDLVMNNGDIFISDDQLGIVVGLPRRPGAGVVKILWSSRQISYHPDKKLKRLA